MSSWWEHGGTQADVLEKEPRDLHLDPRQQEKTVPLGPAWAFENLRALPW